VGRLTNKEDAAELRAGIDPTRATPPSVEDVALAYESPETTHLSVVAESGKEVSMTYTLEESYGMKAVVAGAAFLLNNEMGDFNGKPGLTTEAGLIGTEPNLARPGKTMLSSMTPTIVAKDGELVAVVGSPGGRTIINTVLQVVLNLIDHGMDVQEAVNAKRIHHQWFPDRIAIEAAGADDATVETLRSMGHTVRVGGQQGRAHSILIDARSGVRMGAADPRDGDAGAVGH
jgi:gamma-glutamyltranspeptidase/glutathione hydrolase